MYKKLLIAFISIFSILPIHAGSRTIVNSSSKDVTFTAVQIGRASKGRFSWEPIAGITPVMIKSNHTGTIDLGEGNQSCINIQASSQHSLYASDKLCDGGQLCWNGKSWGVDCN